jgi:hypothetical protein
MTFMRTKTFLASFFVSMSFLLTGCDQVKEKLGMADKKEEASKDDDKKDKKKKKSNDEEEDEKPSSSASAATSASAAPSSSPAATPSGPIGQAASHLPGDCDAVVTLNVSKILAHQAFASQVVPALDEALKKASTEGKEAAKVDSFLKATGMSHRNIQDVAVCVKDASPEPSFGMVMAGGFQPDSVVPAFEKADPSVTDKIKDLDGRKVVSDAEMTLGQYTDGSIALAKTPEFFKAMTNTGDALTSKYKVDGSKELVLAFPEGSIAKLSNSAGKPLPPELSGLKAMTLTLDLAGNKFVIRAVTTSPDEAKKLEAFITLAKSQGGGAMAGLPPGTADILKNLATRIEGNDLIVEAPIPPEAIQSVATLAAEALRKETSSTLDSMFAGGPADPKKADPKAETKPTATPTATAKPTATAATPTATAKPTGRPTVTARPGGLRVPVRK